VNGSVLLELPVVPVAAEVVVVACEAPTALVCGLYPLLWELLWASADPGTIRAIPVTSVAILFISPFPRLSLIPMFSATPFIKARHPHISCQPYTGKMSFAQVF
jgi:hypothetical protein